MLWACTDAYNLHFAVLKTDNPVIRAFFAQRLSTDKELCLQSQPSRRNEIRLKKSSFVLF